MEHVQMMLGARKLVVVAITVLIGGFLLINTSPEVLAIVYGAIISAFIGIVSVYFTGKIHEHEWRRENVYKPLYNELSNVIASGGSSLYEGFSPKWREIDGYSKLRVDKIFRTDLDNYEIKFTEFEGVLKRYKDALERLSCLLENAVISVLREQMIVDGKSIILEGDSTGGPYTSIDVKTWVGMFKDVLLSPKSGSELYESLVKFSEEGRYGYERYFQEWYSKNPEIFDRLVYEFTHPHLPVEREIIARELAERKKVIIISASALKTKLEKRIANIWWIGNGNSER